MDNNNYGDLNNSYAEKYYNNDSYNDMIVARPDVAESRNGYEARLERIKARIDNALETDRRLELYRSLTTPLPVCRAGCIFIS